MRRVHCLKILFLRVIRSESAFSAICAILKDIQIKRSGITDVITVYASIIQHAISADVTIVTIRALSLARSVDLARLKSRCSSSTLQAILSLLQQSQWSSRACKHGKH